MLLPVYVISMEIQGFFEEIDYNELQFLEVCFAALALGKKLINVHAVKKFCSNNLLKRD